MSFDEEIEGYAELGADAIVVSPDNANSSKPFFCLVLSDGAPFEYSEQGASEDEKADALATISWQQ